jgi:hypothetical protein
MKMNLREPILIAIATLMMAAAAHAQTFGPWSTAVNLGSIINSPCNDQHPALSKDGLTLIFASNRPATPGQPCVSSLHLWVSQRDSLDSPWQTPEPLTILNSAFASTYEDSAPNFTTDGHWLFFHSQRPSDCVPGGGIIQLWAAHRQNKRDDAGWESPINLGCVLNGPTDDAGPTFFEDDGTGTLYLYFARDLLSPAADPLGLAIDVYVSTCNADLDSCNRQQLWGPGTNVSEFNSSRRDTRTAIRRRDGLEMFISSNRLGAVGGLDLWVSNRASVQEAWSIPININQDNVLKGSSEIVNTTANDSAPTISWDGQTLIFYSNRAGAVGTDLYMTTREKLTGPQ